VRTDPFMSFQFTVSVDTKNGTQVVGGFSDVSGLTAETEVETLRVGGLNNAELTLPGPTKFPSRLTLKRGLGDAAMLWKWYLSGEMDRSRVARGHVCGGVRVHRTGAQRFPFAVADLSVSGQLFLAGRHGACRFHPRDFTTLVGSGFDRLRGVEPAGPERPLGERVGCRDLRKCFGDL